MRKPLTPRMHIILLFLLCSNVPFLHSSLFLALTLHLSVSLFISILLHLGMSRDLQSFFLFHFFMHTLFFSQVLLHPHCLSCLCFVPFLYWVPVIDPGEDREMLNEFLTLYCLVKMMFRFVMAMK